MAGMAGLTRLARGMLAGAILTLAGPAAAESELELITIGTGVTTGVYYPVGGAICSLVNDGRWEHGIRCVTKSSDGSIANLNALSTGAIDFALVQSDWHALAYAGGGLFAEGAPMRQLRSVLSLHVEPFTLVASRDAGISSIDDLKGKRVNIGEPGAGRRATMEVVMDAFGWSRDDFAVAAEIPIIGQARALCDGELDAVSFVIGHPNRAIEELLAACDAVLVPAVGPAIDRLVEKAPYYRKYAIPGGIYEGQPDPTPTFALSATLVTTARADGRVVHAVVRAVFDNLEAFRRMHPVLAELNPMDMRSAGLAAPLHPGAQLHFWQRRQATSPDATSAPAPGGG